MSAPVDVFALANGLLGPGSVRRGTPPVPGPAALVRAGERWCIVLDPTLTRREARRLVAHELGHWLAQRDGRPDTEDEADAIGRQLLGEEEFDEHV